MSMLATIGLAVGKMVAPKILGSLTKGRGEVVEKIAKAALDIAGLGENASENDVMEHLRNNPDAMIRLREIALEEMTLGVEKEIKLAQFDAADRASAREMHTANKDPIIVQLVWLSGCFLVAAFLAVIALVVLTSVYGWKIDPIFVAIISGMVGSASSRFDQVLNFFFGSSMGSKNKSKRLNDLEGVE